jgi:excisionase family DNA binding protein
MAGIDDARSTGDIQPLHTDERPKLPQTQSDVKARVVNAEKRLFTVEEAGLYLGRTAKAVRRLIEKSQLPVIRHGRSVRLDRHALDRFIESGRR